MRGGANRLREHARSNPAVARAQWQPEHPDDEAVYRPRSPISGYALAAARHMYEFGTTAEQLAEVAVAARRWAQLNPKAFARSPLSVDDVLGSRIVSSPLHVLDCCLVTDGGGAVVVTRTDRGGGTLRRLHDQHDPVPRGPGLLREGRGRPVRDRRAHRS